MTAFQIRETWAFNGDSEQAGRLIALRRGELALRPPQVAIMASFAERGRDGVMESDLLAQLEAEIGKAPAGPRVNVRGGLKALVSVLSLLESHGVDHLEDKEIARLFTVDGKPVNAGSLKTIRNSMPK